jgi:hypothetical protein
LRMVAMPPLASLRAPVPSRHPVQLRASSGRSALSARAIQSRPRAGVRLTTSMASLYDFSPKLLGTGTPEVPLQGAVQPLSAYKGKVVMIQNVATL